MDIHGNYEVKKYFLIFIDFFFPFLKKPFGFSRAVVFVKNVSIILKELIVTSALLDSKEGLMFL